MSSLFDLSGKVAIVTGSSKGIGRAIAEALAELGAEVVKFEKSLDRASEAYSRLGVGIGVFAAASSLATNGKMSFLSFIFVVIK